MRRRVRIERLAIRCRGAGVSTASARAMAEQVARDVQRHIAGVGGRRAGAARVGDIEAGAVRAAGGAFETPARAAGAIAATVRAAVERRGRS